ncbi:hypothetical protein ACFPC0_11045 [Streptomyces andamanensis]|uniref:Uncharacterized protein n=1 Tax=Streptomyces andamanensis TaxID=1565035 RepID=A0ABV8TCN5_9ACTN
MTIYAVHQHNDREGSPQSPLEAFPSVERATVALQLRSRKQECATFYASDKSETWLKEPVAFPDADMTGFMRIWRRKGSDPQPDPAKDTPEEVWRMKETGGVTKCLWAEDTLGGGSAPQTALSPQARRRKALKALADVPPLTAEFQADVSATWRRVLSDLVQDPEVEDGILRVMQADREARS